MLQLGHGATNPRTSANVVAGGESQGLDILDSATWLGLSEGPSEGVARAHGEARRGGERIILGCSTRLGGREERREGAGRSRRYPRNWKSARAARPEADPTRDEKHSGCCLLVRPARHFFDAADPEAESTARHQVRVSSPTELSGAPRRPRARRARARAARARGKHAAPLHAN